MTVIHPYVNAWLSPEAARPIIYRSEEAQAALAQEVRQARCHFDFLRTIADGFRLGVRIDHELAQYDQKLTLIETASSPDFSLYLGLRLFSQHRQLAATAAVAFWNDPERQFEVYLNHAKPSPRSKTPDKCEGTSYPLSDLLKRIVERQRITPTELLRRMQNAGVAMSERTFWRWYWGRSKELKLAHRRAIAGFLSQSGASFAEIAAVFGEAETVRHFPKKTGAAHVR